MLDLDWAGLVTCAALDMGYLAEAKEVDYGLLTSAGMFCFWLFILFYFYFLNNNIQEQLQFKTLETEN